MGRGVVALDVQADADDLRVRLCGGVVRRGGADGDRHGCPGLREVVNQSLFYARTASAARTRERDMDLARYLRTIPDFPKPGIQFKDITPLLADPTAFRESIRQMVA